MSLPAVKEMIDITAPEVVEILIKHDSKVIWINIDGVCMLRACRIKYLEINDETNDATEL